MSLKPGSSNNTNQALNYSLRTTTSFCMFCVISSTVIRTGDQAAKGQVCKHRQAHTLSAAAGGARHSSEQHRLEGAKAALPAGPAHIDAAGGKEAISSRGLRRRRMISHAEVRLAVPADQSRQQSFSTEGMPTSALACPC